MNWRPSADLATLRQRAALLKTIRAFFDDRGVLEVETPLLSSNTITDPALEPLRVEGALSIDSVRYLQTSPEYHMKRLLAAHGEPIYQICKAFRDGEAGPRHNPEFSLLEWYRPGLDHHALMDEVEALVLTCVKAAASRRVTYAQLFEETVGLDPHAASAAVLEDSVRARVEVGDMQGDKDLWLDVLMTHVVEPTLAEAGLVFVYDYPASQAALARIAGTDGARVGERFELYLDGVELANGYHELVDADELRERFAQDNAKRARSGLPTHPVDEALLSAMAEGLPPCSGVALGLDRLLMAVTGATAISSSISFDWSRA